VPDLTLPELAARVAAIEARLGITPAPVPTPAPAPGPLVPAAPTGLRATTLADRGSSWTGIPRRDKSHGTQILDLLNKGNPVKETVTPRPRSARPSRVGDKRRYALRARSAARGPRRCPRRWICRRRRRRLTPSPGP
jgi:hypothetical protein